MMKLAQGLTVAELQIYFEGEWVFGVGKESCFIAEVGRCE